MNYRPLFIFLIVLPLLIAPGCSKKGDTVVANVGSASICVTDAAEIMSGGGYTEDLDGVREALEHLVDFKLLLAGATAEGLDSTADFRKNLRVMQENFIVRKLYEEVVVKNASATEEELQAYFVEHKLGEEQVEVRHILIGYQEGDGEQARQEAIDKAEKILEEAKGDADFAVLATEHSDGPTAPKGGYLGYFPRGRMVKPFEDAAFSLGAGELSEVVVTQFGFHIIKVEDKKSRTLDEMREEVRTFVEQPKRQKLSRDFMKELELNANISYSDEAIDRMIILLGDAESPEEAIDDGSLVIATYNGGEWTTGRYFEFYSDVPADYMNTPKDREEVKAVLKGLIRNELLIEQAKETGIDSRPEFKKELNQLEDDALVQIFIKNMVYIEPNLTEDEIKSYYEEHKETYAKPYEEVQDLVNVDMVDERRQKRLDELTVPLKEQFQVVLVEEALPLILEELKRKK